MIIAIMVGVIQIFLSINLIIRRKNKVAILSEIFSSLILLAILSAHSKDAGTFSWRYMTLALGEYFSVKFFLVIFMTIARIYSFYTIKKLCNNKKKTRKSKRNLKIINKFNQAKYWPNLKLGIPSKAGRRHEVTKIKFDSKGFPEFKSYYTVKLQRRDYRKSREQHFYIANKMLYKNLLSNSRLREKFSKQEIKAFSQGKTPTRYTWHHHQDKGVLQLVEYEVHFKTPHIGGYSIWGGK